MHRKKCDAAQMVRRCPPAKGHKVRPPRGKRGEDMLQPAANNDLTITSPSNQISPFTGGIDAERLLKIFLSNKSDRTIAAYKKDLTDFARFLGIEDGNLDQAARSFLSNGRG